MVDVTLRAIDANLPQDCYVAMRIGDVQKLGRISSERMYKFPKKDVGEYRYGKIEVFQCVGRATVGVIPEDDGEQHVKVRFGDRDLRFNLQLAASAEKIEPNVEEKPMFKPLKPKLEKARKYLKRHHLEARLKEVMSDIINELPEDPAEFIGQRLKKNAGVVVPRQSSIEKQEAAWLTFVAENVDYDVMMKNDLAEEVTSKVQHAIASEARNDVQPQDVILKLAPGSVKVQALVHSTSPDLVFSTLSASQRLSAKLQENLSVVNGIGDISSAPVKITHLRVRRRMLQESGDIEDGEAVAKTNQSKSAPSDLEFLRQQAKEVILDATSTGRLDEALTKVKQMKGSPNDTEALRQEAKQALLAATASGELDDALTKTTNNHRAPANHQPLELDEQLSKFDEALEKIEQPKGAPPDSEELRQQAMKTLLDATSTGKLGEALAKMKQPKSAPPDSEEMRQQAKKSLLEATLAGKLDEALARVQQPKSAPPDSEELRQQAMEKLLDATLAGKLDEALARVQQPKIAPRDSEELRQQAKQKLLDATLAGKLDEALARVQQPKSGPPDSEELRQQAKQKLLDATSSGKLDEALARVQQPTSVPPESEELRQQAMQKLLGATLTGKLGEALATVQQPKSVPPDSEELLQQAKQSLLDAESSGRLDEALARVHQPPPEYEVLLREAKQSLLFAASSGSLDEALATENQPKNGPPDSETLRQKAKQALVEATSTGRLENALNKLKQNKSGAPDHDSLREEAKQILLDATANGKLDEALAKARKFQGPTSRNEELRKQAQEALLEATNSGKLDEALANAGKEANTGDSEVRRRIQDNLLQASATGKLEEALRGTSNSQDSLVKDQLKKTLLLANDSGKLEDVLKTIVGDRAETKQTSNEDANNDPDAFREQLRNLLFEAAKDGRLEQSLAEKPQVDSEDLELKALKREARQKLRDATTPQEINKCVRIVQEANSTQKEILPSIEETAPAIKEAPPPPERQEVAPPETAPPVLASPRVDSALETASAKQVLDDGLKGQISEIVGVTVKESMDGAMDQVMTRIKSELRPEFEVRDKQCQELRDNVAKLSESVAQLQRQANAS